ncbi:hypothetical protein [Nonomuraea sediminis]|uniref:hypothetical protein n=1 Tax=Nonomuraea sediminis TaxID=2835864 RepID=UPI001BDD4D25|nr:hypothetical protein [Nonomuraea sediminis]
MPSNVNVELSQGDDTARTWQITADSTPLNVSAGTVTAVIKRTQLVDDDDPTAIHRSAGDGLTVVDAAQGKVEIRIPTTVAASPGAWWYKIGLTINGKTEVVIDGWLTVLDT